MSSWGQRCGCRNHTANTNVGCPYNVKSGVCDNCEKYCTVRDERSEESAEYSYPIEKMLWFMPEDLEAHESKILQAERTRIIKALEGLRAEIVELSSDDFYKDPEAWKVMAHEQTMRVGFNQAIFEAIKAVGESAGNEG